MHVIDFVCKYVDFFCVSSILEASLVKVQAGQSMHDCEVVLLHHFLANIAASYPAKYLSTPHPQRQVKPGPKK